MLINPLPTSYLISRLVVIIPVIDTYPELAAGLVNSSVRTEWLALLMCGADAAGYADGELALTGCLATCCWMRLAFRGRRRALNGQQLA